MHQRRGTLTDEQVTRQIDELEQALQRGDPSPAEQFDERRRARARMDITVFSLLGAAVVLLALALATTSPIAGIGGVLAYVTAFGVGQRCARELHRPPPADTRPAPPR